MKEFLSLMDCNMAVVFPVDRAQSRFRFLPVLRKKKWVYAFPHLKVNFCFAFHTCSIHRSDIFQRAFPNNHCIFYDTCVKYWYSISHLFLSSTVGKAVKICGLLVVGRHRSSMHQTNHNFTAQLYSFFALLIYTMF